MTARHQGGPVCGDCGWYSLPRRYTDMRGSYVGRHRKQVAS